MSVERLEKIIEKRNALESLAKKYPDVLGDEYAANCGEDLKLEEKIRENYREKVDANRELQVGIVGRVKAGKSSLLNALLFDGKIILPKAATPMTAALTILSYAEKLEVKIRFFEENDFAALRDKSAVYEKKMKELIELKVEEDKQKAKENPVKRFDEGKSRERAERSVRRLLNEDIGLSGAYDQYQKIKQSSVAEDEVVGKIITLYPKSLEEISLMLADYVGSEGKYMPFTQSVEIAYPNEKLKGMRIVDTPGFNDPVPSREDRAYQLLKASDVVLILSPAGRYLDETDKDVLEKITVKDGLRELFVVASQIDTQLYGDEYKVFNGDVFKVRDEIGKRLSGQTTSVLSSLNIVGVFDQLINDDGNRIVLTSGDCHSMYLTFDRRVEWDSNKNQIWNNLCAEFRDYFSDKDANTSRESLKRLGNTILVEQKLEDVKKKKDEILANSGNQICQSLENAVESLKEGMSKALTSQISRIQTCNLDTLQNEKNGIESFCMKVEPGISRAVNESVADWRSEATRSLVSFVNDLSGDARSDANHAKSEFTRHHSYTTGHLWWKQSHEYTTQHTRVNVVQLRSSVEDYISKVNNSIKMEVLEELEQLKRKISSKIAIVWAEKAAEQSLDSDAVANRIRAIIEGLNLPDFKLPEGGLPQELKGSGSLEDERGDNIMAVCRAHLSKLANTLSKKLTDEIASYAGAISKADIAKELLSRYHKQLDNLIKDIQNKEQSIVMYEKVKKELEAIA